ncbi:MAG TPA: Gfo/Idh/MocA family oxidoreductase [bacterium]|nr:Gfo/Idh/MocA family oxidoreductase [bacterium]
MARIRWGILSTAKIAVEKVIPAMQQGEFSKVTGIASRSAEKAQQVAEQLDIPKSYGTYEELLAEPDIQAVYIPLPNHLHVPWSVRSLEAGKHVLCEKPIALDAKEAQTLAEEAKKYPSLKIMEAFMYRHHPQWRKAKQVVEDGGIGTLRTIQSFFSYYNINPENIRNMPDIGGGGLMDIGCYPVSLSRFIFDAEPERVFGEMEFDPNLKIDRLGSGILDFGTGVSTFTYGTQLTPYQWVNIFGTEGRIEIEIPFNAPSDKPCKIWHQTGPDTRGIVFETVDQYTLQGDLFSKAIIEKTGVPTPISDAVANMKVIDALVWSAENNTWVQ